MRHITTIVPTAIVLAVWFSPVALAQGKKPKGTDTSGVFVTRQSSCDGLNSVLKAPATIDPDSVVLITADLPWCDVRVEIPGIVITADDGVPADNGIGKPKGFARLHSVTLSSAAITVDSVTTVYTASDTTLRNLWVDSNQGIFTFERSCGRNCTATVTVNANAVDAVAVNADPAVGAEVLDSNGDPTGIFVRDEANGQAGHASQRVVVENGFIFAGRNGVVALRAEDGGADRLTIQGMDIHVSDAESFAGDGLNRAGVISLASNQVSILRNLIAGDVDPVFPPETVGILVDDPCLGSSACSALNSSVGMTVSSNLFTDLLAIGEFNNHRSGSFSRNDSVNTRLGIALIDAGGVDPFTTDCVNKSVTGSSTDSALWVVGHNKLEATTVNGIEVQGGCAHAIANNILRAANFGIAFFNPASHNSVAGNNLTETLVGVFLDSGTEFNDVIGRSGGLFEQDDGSGEASTNTITGNKLQELPLGITLDTMDLKPDHS